MKTPKVLVLAGYGINCDYETQVAFEKAGADAQRVHINELISNEQKMEDYHIFFIPGGFSYGDELGAGKILANKLMFYLKDDLLQFIADEKLVGGHCNGAQVMAKAGLIPALIDYQTQQLTLTVNETARYEDRWVHVKSVSEKCIWTKNLPPMQVPVAHGEGRFYSKEPELIQKLEKNDQIALIYTLPDGTTPAQGTFPYNPNGSVADIAGICDPTGRVFAQMPHPERFISLVNHPHWTKKVRNLIREGTNIRQISWDGDGLLLFKNAVNYAKEHLL